MDQRPTNVSVAVLMADGNDEYSDGSSTSFELVNFSFTRRVLMRTAWHEWEVSQANSPFTYTIIRSGSQSSSLACHVSRDSICRALGCLPASFGKIIFSLGLVQGDARITKNLHDVNVVGCYDYK